MPLTIERELRVVTESSVWLVRRDSYLRLPRGERPRRPTPDLDGATADGAWHEHEGVWLLDDPDERLRILPAGRPAGALGLITGVILERAGGPPRVQLPDEGNRAFVLMALIADAVAWLT